MLSFKKYPTILGLSAMLLCTYTVTSTTNTPVTVQAQTKLSAASYHSPESTNVTPENFNQYISLHAQATKHSDGTITLTQNEANQIGGLYLNEKIDLDKPFSISGKINLGDKFSGQYDTAKIKGGDGISLLFIDGDAGTFGLAGETLGLGTIKNSFGFKFDSHHNGTSPAGNPYADADPFLFGGNQQAFGTFIYSNYRGNVSTLNADFLDKPSASNALVPFSLQYGGKENPVITVTYNQKTFTHTLNARLNKSTAKTRAFAIFASTKDGTNLQQVKIETLSYSTVQAKIVIQYVNDITGEMIQPNKELTGGVGETKDLTNATTLPHYTLAQTNVTTATGFQADQTVALVNGTQTITYTYTPIYKELYTPVAKDNVSVGQGEHLTPEHLLTNKDTLPKDTKITWKEGKSPDTTTIGKIKTTLVITYPDNTNVELPIELVVTKQSNNTNTKTTDQIPPKYKTKQEKTGTVKQTHSNHKATIKTLPKTSALTH